VENVAVTAYSDATRLQALNIHAGDNVATLTGSGLGEVRAVKLAGAEYKPTEDQPGGGKELRLTSSVPKAKPEKGKPSPLTTAGESGSAEAVLADGRTLPVGYVVDAARPSVELLTKASKADAQGGLPLQLANKDDLPLNARITFALRSSFPARFPRSEKIEIALADGSLRTTLSLSDGSVVLQDQHTALAFFSPAKAFGASAFGPLQLRAVAEDGTAGDWIPVGTLVRTPIITGITCARSSHAALGSTAAAAITEDAVVPSESRCQIAGTDLYLLDQVSADSSFSAPADVPLGFAGEALPVPRPADNRTLFLKLRDDPDSVLTVTAAVPLPAASHHGTAASALPAPATPTTAPAIATPAANPIPLDQPATASAK
jgi:hypothetical protein